MKGRTPLMYGFLFGLFVCVSVAGCATVQPVQYASGGVNIEKPLSERKFSKPLILKMNEELLNLVVTVKPLNIPGAMSYHFYVGESIRSNIVNTLSPLYQSIKVSTLPMKDLTNHGVILDVALINYSFDIASSVLGEHIVKLNIEYKYYEDGKKIFSVLTETSGTSKEILTASIRKTFDDWKRFPITPNSAAMYVLDMGNAYDAALSKSIDKLVGKLSEAWGS